MWRPNENYTTQLYTFGLYVAMKATKMTATNLYEYWNKYTEAAFCIEVAPGVCISVILKIMKHVREK